MGGTGAVVRGGGGEMCPGANGVHSSDAHAVASPLPRHLHVASGSTLWWTGSLFTTARRDQRRFTNSSQRTIIGASSPSCWEGVSLLFRTRVEGAGSESEGAASPSSPAWGWGVPQAPRRGPGQRSVR